MEELDLIAINTQWMEVNRLKLNVGKTTIMLIVGRQNALTHLSSVEVKIGCPIERVKSMNILGVIFDENFSWSEHMKKVITKCNLT
jgi:hypothetical protein